MNEPALPRSFPFFHFFRNEGESEKERDGGSQRDANNNSAPHGYKEEEKKDPREQVK